MSVPNQTPYIIYNANGLTTVFPFEFYIINAGDIQVTINGAPVTSGYTVSGAGNVGGGDIIFLTPPVAGSVVMLERVVPTYRLTDYQDNGDLLADTVNKDFDRLWMAIQRSFIYLGLALRRPLLGGPFNAEGYRITGLADPVNDSDAVTKKYLNEVSLAKTLRTPENITSLPPVALRAGKLIGFDGYGNPIPVLPESGSAADVLLLLAAANGYTYIPSMEPYVRMQRWRDEGDVRGWGAKCNGMDDDTLTVQQAIDDRRGIGPVIIPKPTVCSSLTVYSDTHLKGCGRGISKLIAKPGSNKDFITGGSSDNTIGAHRVKIEDLWIYCAPGSNTTGSGITIYGKETSFRSIRVTGFPDNNIHTHWTAIDTGVSGMEGFFDDIIAEMSGKHNWLFEGPHDSNCSRVILIDASQKNEATYDGLSCRGISGNARWTGVHAWTNYGNKRMRCALYCDRNAGGNEFELSHFEGAQFANVYILANNVTIGESCKVYYPWGGVNIILAGSACRISPTIMEEYKGIGLPLAKGIVFAGDYGGPSGSEINCLMLGQDAGAIDFGASGGYNNVTIRGYNGYTGNSPYLGSPAETDEINFLISGTKLSILKKNNRMVNNPVYSATTAGSTQSTANGVSQTASTIYVSNSPGALSGILIQNATIVGNGFEVTISNVNSSGTSIKVYPQPGHQFIGNGVDNPITLAFGKSAQFRVVDADAGKWIVLQGA